MIEVHWFWLGVFLLAAASAGLWLAVWRFGRSVRSGGDMLLEEARRESVRFREEAARELEREEREWKKRNVSYQSQIGDRLYDHQERLGRMESALQEQEELLSQKESWGEKLDGEIREKKRENERLHEEMQKMRREIRAALLEKAGSSEERIRSEYLDSLEKQTAHEEEIRGERYLRQFEETVEEEARRIVEVVIQRVVPDYVEDVPTWTFKGVDYPVLPKLLKSNPGFAETFKQVTGVPLEWKEAEGTAVLACQNSVEKELARRTLRKVIKNPKSAGRVADLYHHARRELQGELRRTIQKVTRRLGIEPLNRPMSEMMSRLKYRTSHSQNVLSHSYEVGRIAAMLSAELGLDPKLGKRGGFLHDVGKGMDEQDGGHALVGGEYAEKHGENPTVVNAIAGHHEDVPRTSLYPVIAQVADAISGGRPGARRETSERYLERVSLLEEIARSKPGVENVFVIQGGREVRVQLNCHKVRDEEVQYLCDQLTKEVDEVLAGQGVEITVTRETKVVSYAK